VTITHKENEVDNDFEVENHVSIFLLRPLTKAAQVWCDEHLPQDAQKWANAYVVEHRFIGDVVEGLQADGYSIAAFAGVKGAA
jgi:hypothetical protein